MTFPVSDERKEFLKGHAAVSSWQEPGFDIKKALSLYQVGCQIL